MAWAMLLFVLWSTLQATLAFKGNCSKPDFKVENVDMSEITDTYFEVGQRLRLKCQSGYKRKAGTSNLIRCENNSQQVMWSKPNLMCIRTEPVTARTAVAERTVKPTTASETAPDVTITIDLNETEISGRTIGIIVGTSTSSLCFITISVLLLLWFVVFKYKIGCTRSQEYELTPVPPTEVLSMTNLNETEPLQQEAES